MKYLILRGTKVARRKGSVAIGKVKSKIWPTVKNCLLFMLLVGYAFAGAILFYYLEGEPEKKRILRRINETDQLRQEYLETLVNITVDCNGTMADECPEMFKNATLHYEEQLEEALGFYIDQRKSTAYKWTFWNAFYYSFTIATTIGYGNISCHTRWCRIATIGYALFGIPLVLTVLKYMGHGLFKRASWIWRMLKKAGKKVVKMFRIHILRHKELKITRQPSTTTQGSLQLEDIEAGFPLLLAIAVVLIYLFGIAYAFFIWESSWDYMDAFYFFFITMSTIGLGDQVPPADDQGYKYIIGFILVMVGLALVSMCINVIQNRVEQTYLKTLLKMENRFVLGSIDDLTEDVEQEAGALSRMGSALGVLRVSRRSHGSQRASRRTVIEVDGDDGEPVMIVPLRSASKRLSRLEADEIDTLDVPSEGHQHSSPSRVTFSEIPEEILQLQGHGDHLKVVQRLPSVYDNHKDDVKVPTAVEEEL